MRATKSIASGGCRRKRGKGSCRHSRMVPSRRAPDRAARGPLFQQNRQEANINNGFPLGSGIESLLQTACGRTERRNPAGENACRNRGVSPCSKSTASGGRAEQRLHRLVRRTPPTIDRQIPAVVTMQSSPSPSSLAAVNAVRQHFASNGLIFVKLRIAFYQCGQNVAPLMASSGLRATRRLICVNPGRRSLNYPAPIGRTE